jgi:hypothetical protein
VGTDETTWEAQGRSDIVTNALVAQTAEEAALLKAVGLDRVPPEQRALALNIADRYGLDLMLKHVVLIDGRPMITRDGLLHIAHRSGQFDGIEVTDPVLEGGYWHARATVWRKDMSRGFTFSGRYPAQGGNAKYAPEMATKTAESHAFRRAFDISAPTVDEQWDDVQVPEPRPTLATLTAKVAARRADIEARVDVPPTTKAVVSVAPEAPADEMMDAAMPDEPPLPPEPPVRTVRDPATMGLKQCPVIGGDKRDQCIRAPGHRGDHDNGQDRWA